MRSLRLILPLVGAVFAGAPRARPAVTAEADGRIGNGLVEAAPVREAAGCTGVRVTARGGLAVTIRLGPRDALVATRTHAEVRGGDAVLRLSGISAPDGCAGFAADSAVVFELSDGSPWPRFAFDIRLEAFDRAAWQAAAGATVPFHILLCEVPGAGLFYQGGGMIPLPEVDPFPFSAAGFMAGNWAPGWSYAPAMAGWAVPAVGLWDPRAAAFVAYDFIEQRHTDRSGEALATAGCLGNQGPPFFCVVYPSQRQWVELTYPTTPCRIASHGELLYSRDLPDSADPNQFVLERVWREKRSLLPPVPRMNDLAWIPEFDAFCPGGGIEPTAVGIGLLWHSIDAGLEGAFVEPGTTMLGNDFIADAVLRARCLHPEAPLDRLRRDAAYLMERCTWLEVNGERCAVWRHPLEGRFKEQWGGERCAGVHHPSTFQIGAGMLRLYQAERDERLLPFIDGVYRWCRHYLFTRNGVCDLPWAMFSREATAVGENFLLLYRQTFRADPERARNAEEALRLARTAVYKNLWFYTADPDPADDLDPTFLNQATNDGRWAGRVTWNEAGWVLRTMVPLYCESGDPLLKYLLRGAAERYYAGFREDGGVAENLQILGEIEPKGLRTAGFPDAQHGGILRRWARPLPPAVLRVAMGERAAIAFCLGTRSYDVAEYAFAPDESFAFRLAALPGAPAGVPIDLVATAPFRDLRGKPVAVNGQVLPADRIEFNPWTAGEDVFIRGVRPGDAVLIGRTPTPPAPSRDTEIPYRGVLSPAPAPWHCVDLGPSCTVTLARQWWAPESWFGLVPGRRVVRGVPVDLADPDSGAGKDALARGTVPIGRPCGAVFAVFGRLRGHSEEGSPAGRLRLEFEGAPPQDLDVRDEIPFDLTNGFPLRRFDTCLGAAPFEGSPTLRSVRVEEGVLLALTIAEHRDAPEVREALAWAAAARSRTLAARAQHYCQSPAERCPETAPWADGMVQPWRFRIRTLPGAGLPANAILKARQDFPLLLSQAGLAGRAAPSSLRAVEVTTGRPPAAVPVQFDPLAGTDGQRGEMFLMVPGPTPPGESRQFEVYFGPDPLPAAAPAVSAAIDPDRVAVDSGPGGVRFEFALDGGQGHPRWTRLAFDLDGDGAADPPENALGPSGFNGGLADLTTCTDWVTWYDFGALQSRPAQAEVVNAGPVAATVCVSGLELWGQGDTVPLGTRRDGRPFGASPAGEARWYFRFYARHPVVEHWVDLRLASLRHGWTRPLQVRYGLYRWQAGASATLEGQSMAIADDLAVLALPPEAGTYTPECLFTADGNVLQVAFTLPDALGDYYTGRWLTLPPRMPEQERRALACGVAFEQFAVETLAAGKAVRPPPQPARLIPFDRTGGRGPGPRPAVTEAPPAEGILNPDPSFEHQETYWTLGSGDMAARWTFTNVYSGKVALDLSCTARTLALAATNARGSQALDLAPDSRYEVCFQARCTSGEGEVHANFYAPEPGCDFPHVITPVPADGQWHPIRIELATGRFTPRSRQPGVFARSQGVAPALRLWTIRKAQNTYVDQVEVRPLP